jgi:hypothetical protein
LSVCKANGKCKTRNSLSPSNHVVFSTFFHHVSHQVMLKVNRSDVTTL